MKNRRKSPKHFEKLLREKFTNIIPEIVPPPSLELQILERLQQQLSTHSVPSRTLKHFGLN